MKQLTHYEINNVTPKIELIVISENIRTPENVGMLLRVAEAFGAKSVYLIGDSPNLTNKKVLRTARSSNKNLNVIFFKDSKNSIQQLKKDNYYLIGLEYTNNSIEINKIEINNHHKIALFVGAERFGLTKQTLEQLDIVTHINLFGKNSSINVVNALAIALYKITE